jgi:hypothetical protein
MADRYGALKHIETLDAEKNAHEIVAVSSAYDFAQDTEIALGLAFFRTFAVPSIAKILDATKQFENFGQKRYDDTTLLLAEFLENGLDSDRGKKAIRRLNQIHNEYDIPNEDFIYTLTTFIFEPIRWNARFGWRPMVEKEKLASVHFWLKVGKMMGIKKIPRSYAALENFNLDFEKEHFRYTPESERVSRATLEVVAKFLPKLPFLKEVTFESIYALLDQPLRRAVGFPDPNPAVLFATETIFRTRAYYLRHFGATVTEPIYVTKRKFPSYPDGYSIAELGPKVAEKNAAINQKADPPF